MVKNSDLDKLSNRLVERVNTIAEKSVKELADQIAKEMREILRSHMKTGNALASIKVHNDGGGRLFIGGYAGDGENMGLLYLDQGNGGSGTMIFPNKAPTLRFQGYKGRYRGKWYSPYAVHGYDGIHFVKQVADKHR